MDTKIIAKINVIWLPICIFNAVKMVSYFGRVFAVFSLTDITYVWAILDTSLSYEKKVILKIAVTNFKPRNSRYWFVKNIIFGVF